MVVGGDSAVAVALLVFWDQTQAKKKKKKVSSFSACEDETHGAEPLFPPLGPLKARISA